MRSLISDIACCTQSYHVDNGTLVHRVESLPVVPTDAMHSKGGQMDFSLTEEQAIVVESVKAFARDVLLPKYSHWDRCE